MLLVGVLLLSFSMSAWAQKVSLNFRNTKVETVLSSIKKQTGMDMVYSDQILDVNRTVSIQVKDTELTTALNKLLVGTNIAYEIRNKRIYFVEKKNVPQQKQAVSQKLKVSGQVTDENGEPIIGANIMEEGTKSNGTITDVDGNFKLNVAADATLDVTYIGFRTQKVSVKGRTTLDITMKSDTEMLDEVVVVGYGNMREHDLTGAISSVKGKAIEERHAVNLATALQGAVSGLQVTRAGGAPESEPTIRVRGITTMGSNDPLVLVDGIVANLADVNPNDVETLSVLKDAASAAIYGSQAAAGVILITTKRGKANRLSLTYNFEYGLSYFATHPEYDTVERYLQKEAEKGYNDNPTGDPELGQDTERIRTYRENHYKDPDRYPMTDWHEEIYNKFAPSQKHSLSIRGGNNTVRTNVSMSYDKIDAQYDNRSLERIMVRANNTFSLGKFLGADVDINFKRQDRYRPMLDSDIARAAWTMSPMYGAWFTDGRLAEGRQGGGDNGVAYIYQGGQYKNWDTTINGRASLYYKPFDCLKITGVVSPRYVFNKEKKFEEAMPYTTLDNPDEIAGYRLNKKTTSLRETRSDLYDLTVQFYANYKKKFGKHGLDLTAGYEGFYTKYESMWASRSEYQYTEYPYLDMGPKGFLDDSGNARENARRSFYGRLSYNYADRYLFQANIRRDGSSRFHKDHRWGNFPSLSAGWVISEEKFMKNAGIDWLSFLKVRGSWGILGNERISGNYYPYQANVSFGNTILFNGSKTEPVQSAYQAAYAVEDLTWEKTESIDIALDASFFDNRLRFTAEWFKKETTDMLLPVEIPKYIGFDNPQRNVGSMQSKGFELELGWSDHIGELNYSVSLNLSDAVSKIGYMNAPQFTNTNRTIRTTDSSYDEWYGYIADGLFLTQEDLDTYPRFDETQGLGSIIYRDISGPDGVPDGKISPEYDRTFLGDSQPHYLYGGNLSLSYKDFDFSFAFQGVGKHTCYMHKDMYRMRPWFDGHYWSPFNTDEKNAAMKYPRLSGRSEKADNDQLSNVWLFNGRFFRLKNVTLGYTIPQRWTQRVAIQSARLYVAVNDVFSIDNYPQGWDPEGPVSGISYPITSQLLFGVQVNF